MRALHVFRQVYLKPLTDAIANPTPREEALLNFHYRITALVGSARRLNATPNFQSISAAARSVFELGLDLTMVASDETTESVDRVYAFNRVERFRTAHVVTHFYEGKPAPTDFDITTHAAVANDANERAAVVALKQQYWPNANVKKWPHHWGHLSDLRARAHAAGGAWEENYVRHYARLSWFVHGGLVGIVGLPAAMFDVVAAMAYALVEEVVLESFRTLGNELDWTAAIPHWNQWLDFLGHVSGMTLVDLRLQALGEQPHLVHIEPNEENI